VRVFDTETAGCGPLKRRYLERVPPEAAAPGAAWIVLHDAGQSAEAALLETRWWFGELARRTSTLLVYANGGPLDTSAPGAPQVFPGAIALQRNAGVWQGDRGAHPAVDDVAYLHGIVDDLNAQRALQKDSEVFLAGYGSGAVMALVAAMQHPEQYSGVAAFLPSLSPGSAELRKALASAVAPRVLGGAREWRPAVWALRSIFIVLPSTAGKDPSALAEQWAGAFGAEPGAIHVMRQKPGLQRIDTKLGGDLVELRILLLSKQVDPFPLPGGGDETARAASMARPFFFDGPGAAWDFFQRAN
jgi:predicted esterase